MTTDRADSARKIRLWNDWLRTPDGSTYEAGWGDLWNQLHAARGRAWVAERMIEEDAGEIALFRERVGNLRAEIARLCRILDAITQPAPSAEDVEAAWADLPELDRDERAAMASIDIKKIIAWAKDPANLSPEEALRRMIEAAGRVEGFDKKTIEDARVCLERRWA